MGAGDAAGDRDGDCEGGAEDGGGGDGGLSGGRGGKGEVGREELGFAVAPEVEAFEG